MNAQKHDQRCDSVRSTLSNVLLRGMHIMILPMLVYVKRVMLILLTIAFLLGLAACNMTDRAIGDSGRHDDIVHDGIDMQDIRVLIVGSAFAQLDREMLTRFEQAQLRAEYIPTANVTNSVTSAQQAVLEALQRPVSLIVLNAFDVTNACVLAHNEQILKRYQEHPAKTSSHSQTCQSSTEQATEQSWQSVLLQARQAGVPVMLADPIHAPADLRLYAATVHITTRPQHHCMPSLQQKQSTVGCEPASTMSLTGIVRAIIDNTPHPRAVYLK